ncbi:hypothetical protein BJY00DRAFT_308453 [Aspergillus carlsbadensis]|nr:hypothetical protein BJY00DRAFT_308453 [Aspergillus carlsbadensis]
MLVPQDRTAVKITVQDANGREGAIPLDAAIDETIGANIILARLFERLQPHLSLEKTPSGLKTFTDSHGAHYTASNTVTLLIGQQGKNWSAEAVFQISKSQDAAAGGGNRILLGNSLKSRFSLPGEREIVDAAPTVLCYKDSQDKKQRKDDAEKKNPDLRRAARENQEKLDKERKERKDRESAQSASTA